MSSDLARKLAEALKQEFPGSLIEHDMEWIAALLDRAGLAEALADARAAGVREAYGVPAPLQVVPPPSDNTVDLDGASASAETEALRQRAEAAEHKLSTAEVSEKTWREDHQRAIAIAQALEAKLAEAQQRIAEARKKIYLALCDEDCDWDEWAGEVLPLIHDSLLDDAAEK